MRVRFIATGILQVYSMAGGISIHGRCLVPIFEALASGRAVVIREGTNTESFARQQDEPHIDNLKFFDPNDEL
jgi:hypothetical protein